MNNKVSIQRIVGDVIGNLGLKSTNNIIDDFSRWACEAESKIGSRSSFQKYECELVIKNKKAHLPPNLAYLLAVKHGNKFLQTTMRSFSMFDKATTISPKQIGDAYDASCEHTSDCVEGVPLSVNILFSGIFNAGEVITITFTINDCGTINNQTINYIVQAGESLNDIIQNIINQINAVNFPFTAVVTNGGINITGTTPEVNWTTTLYTNSITGFLDQCVIQKRIPTKKNTKVVDKVSFIPKTTSNNLANTQVAMLNTGNSRQGGSYGKFAETEFGDLQTDSVYSINNGCIYFNVVDDTRIGISYMGVMIDEDGFPLVDEGHESAVTSYIMWMYKSIEFYNGKLNAGVYDRLEKRWLTLCSQARGEDELPDRMEMQNLANIWNQLLPLPNKENF